MTPEESKDKLITFVGKTTEALETDGWKEIACGASIQPCTLAGQEDGVNFVYDRIGPGTTDAERAVRVVEEFWKQNGLTTKVVHSYNPNDSTVRLYAVGGGVRVIDFYADQRATSIGAESVCLPGPFSEVVRRMNEQP